MVAGTTDTVVSGEDDRGTGVRCSADSASHYPDCVISRISAVMSSISLSIVGTELLGRWHWQRGNRFRATRNRPTAGTEAKLMGWRKASVLRGTRPRTRAPVVTPLTQLTLGRASWRPPLDVSR